LTPGTPGEPVHDCLRKASVCLGGPREPGNSYNTSVVQRFSVDPDRCIDERFYINPIPHHCQLAKACLLHMSQSLHRDICHVGRIARTNSDIPDLNDGFHGIYPKNFNMLAASGRSISISRPSMTPSYMRWSKPLY